jgi:asparagine N-glycosylation enzyme membrane subunit Stt3
MAKKKAFSILLGFVCATIVAAASNREIFNSWCGYHYTQIGGNIAGRTTLTQNSIIYDSSWTETKAYYRPGSRRHDVSGSSGTPPSTKYVDIYHERRVVFYFDANGIVTSWRSKGWPE